MSTPFSTQYPIPPKPLNIDGSQITNGSIATADIADGAITEAKLASALQTDLLHFGRRLTNLENPGWYGNFKIKNANASTPFSFTFQVYFDTFNIVTNTTDTETVGDPVTLNHGQHYDLVRPQGTGLTNKDTIIRLGYSTSGGNITNTAEVGIAVDNIEEGEIFIIVSKNYIHNGNIELTVTITN